MPAWDIGRFLNTLTYFDALPLANVWKQIQGWSQGQLSSSDPVSLSLSMPHLLWIGQVTPEASHWLKPITQQGIQVFWLTSDMVQARALLGETINLITPDLWPTVALAGIRTVVLDWGSLSDRLQQLNTIVDHFAAYPGQTLVDFKTPTEALRQQWGALDDVVMGGVSESRLQLIEGGALFTGQVSTANSGGFASVRTRNFSPLLNLSGYAGLALRVRGDGQRYKFFVRTDSGWDSIAYALGFDTVASTWSTVILPFTEMIPIFRAKTVVDAPALDPSRITSFQLMLSKFERDKQLNPHFSPGPFALQVESISVYGGSYPQVVLLDRSHGSDFQEKSVAEGILQAKSIRYTSVSDPLLVSSIL
jgi:hypothetical protein